MRPDPVKVLCKGGAGRGYGDCVNVSVKQLLKKGVMKTDRMTLTEAALFCGITPQAMGRKIKRHCCPKGIDGKFSKADIIEVQRVGKLLDKAALSIRADEVSEGGENSLPLQKLRAQVRKLEVEIEILEAERDTELGKLVLVSDAVAAVTKREAHMAGLVRTWTESETAKHPELRREIAAAARTLQQAMSEEIEL